MSGFKKLINTLTSGEPVLNFHKAVSADTLWPTTNDKEADKAAHILRSFFVDGFIVPYRTIGFCPREILKTCRGLAIFHVLRSDLASPNASGSGVLVARDSDGQWSPPAGILIDVSHDFPADVDVLDVVLVVKDPNVLDSLSTGKTVLGDQFSVAPGPVPESEAGDHGMTKHDKNAAVWAYAKSKGQLVDFTFKGLSVREASAENARFYDTESIRTAEILCGAVKSPTGSDNYLSHTLEALSKAGDDYGRLPASGGSPGDKRVKEPARDGK